MLKLQLISTLEAQNQSPSKKKAIELYSPKKSPKKQNKQGTASPLKSPKKSPRKSVGSQPQLLQMFSTNSPTKKRLSSPQKIRNMSPLKKSSSPLKRSGSPNKKRSNMLINMFQKKQKKLNTDNLLKLFQNTDNPQKLFRNLSIEEQQIYRVLNKDQVDLNCQEDSDMAIMILKKVIKNKMEYGFMKKVIEGLSIFQKNPELINSEKLNNKLLNNLKYQHYEKFDTIFEMDDMGYDYFIILKGNVECLIKKNKNADDQFSKDDQKNQQHQFYNKLYPKLFSVKTFTPGESFGEIALLTNQKRTATMVCSTDVDVMTLSKDVFNMIMGDYNNKIMNDKIYYLKSFSFFKNIPTFMLLQLMHSFKTLNFKHNNIIYEEKQKVDNIYFIRQGEIEISKEVQNFKQENQLYSYQNIQKKRVKIMGLGSNSYFGDEEIYRDSKERLNQAKCISFDLEVLCIKKEKLISFLMSKKAYGLFEQDMKIKYQFRDKRQNQIFEALEKENQQKQEQSQVNDALGYLKNPKLDLQQNKKQPQAFIIRNKGKIQSQFNSNNQSQLQSQSTLSVKELQEIKPLKLYQIQHDSGNINEEEINLYANENILSENRTPYNYNYQRKDSRKLTNNNNPNILKNLKLEKEKSVLKGEFIDKFQQQVDHKKQIFEKLQHQQQLKNATTGFHHQQRQQKQNLNDNELVSFDDFIPKKKQFNQKKLNERNGPYISHSAKRINISTSSNFNIQQFQNTSSVQRMKQKVLNEKGMDQENQFQNINQSNYNKQNQLKPLYQHQGRQHNSVHYIQTPQNNTNNQHQIRMSQQNLKQTYNNGHQTQNDDYYKGSQNLTNNTDNQQNPDLTPYQQFLLDEQIKNQQQRKKSMGVNKENTKEINYNNFLEKLNQKEHHDQNQQYNMLNKHQQEEILKQNQKNQVNQIQQYDLNQDIKQHQVPHTLAAFYKKQTVQQNPVHKKSNLNNNHNSNQQYKLGNQHNNNIKNKQYIQVKSYKN